MDDKDEKEKKKSGFFASLWSRLGGGGSGALGEAGLGAGGTGSAGFGGLGGLGAGLGRAGLFGGLLATKAGVVALVLIGSSVAGGLGFLGWKAFGPGAEDKIGGNFQLFSPRPAEPARQDPFGGGSKGGASDSLGMLSGANASKEPAAPPVDAAKPAESAAAADAIGKANDNKANVGGNKAAVLKADRFGRLTSKLEASKGGSAGSAGAASIAAAPLVAAAKSGRGAASPLGARPSVSRRAVGRRIAGGNAYRQLGLVKRDSAGAGNMRTAGTTVDGGAVSGTTGLGASPIGGAGTGAGPDATPPGNPGSGSDSAPRFPESPPSVSAKNVTPWQGAINAAMMLTVGSAVMLMLAEKMNKAGNKMVANILAGLVIMMGLGIIALGSAMSQAPYGQKFQGSMFVLAGGAFIAAAAMELMSINGSGSSTSGATPSPSTGPSPTPAGGAPDPNAVVQASGTGDMSMVMYACMAAGVAAAMVGFIKPAKKIDSSYFQNGKPPDVNIFGGAYNYVVPVTPSQRALERFIV